MVSEIFDNRYKCRNIAPETSKLKQLSLVDNRNLEIPENVAGLKRKQGSDENDCVPVRVKWSSFDEWGVFSWKKYERCVRDGDSTAKTQGLYEQRLTNNEITADLLEKTSLVVFGGNHVTVHILDLLDRKSTTTG